MAAKSEFSFPFALVDSHARRVLKPYSANTLLFAVEMGGVNKGRVFGTAQLTVHALIMVFVKHLKMKLVVTVTIGLFLFPEHH